MGEPKDLSTFWRPAVRGVEVLHAHFRHHEYPRHAHEAATVALMDRGAASFLYRGEVHTASAGDVFLLNPDEVHTGWLAHPEGYRYRVLYLGTEALAQFHDPDSWPTRWRTPPVFRETVVRDPALAAGLDRVHTALATASRERGRSTHGDPEEGRMLQEHLLIEVGEILRARYAEPGLRPAAAATGTEHRAVSAARAYLESRLAEKVSLLDLAATACLSPYRLTRLFSAEVGMPPHAYQNMLRVGRARKLLAEGARGAYIAREVGFCDQAHFNRVFKRYTGVTPRQFQVGVRRNGWPLSHPADRGRA
jgi:AraC-like DNA-binding protein